MLQSLQNTISEPSGTKAAIRQALMSSVGLRLVWVIVEAEEDVAVYEKFMQPNSTVVKTSESETGRKGYANVEIIVREIKEEVPAAHIMGIRDADYLRYKTDNTIPKNIFLTDRRDLEMMLLSTDSVKQALCEWAPGFDAAFAKCVPICRYFAYLRIYNEVENLSVKFHDNLSTTKFWDYQQQAVKDNWEQGSTVKFVELSNGRCSDADVKTFITTHNLEGENFYDICRGHDLLKLLSLTLVNVQIFSVSAIFNKMFEAYTLDDFKTTQLYASIQIWQDNEGVNALAA